MVQIIPNHSKVEGKIISVKQSPDLSNFRIFEIVPTKIEPVAGSANLLDKSSPENLHVHFAKEVQDEYRLKKGMPVSFLARKALDKLFVIPDSIDILPIKK